MTTIISKTTLSGAPPEQARAHAAGLATLPLRTLAVHLAADPALTVSVISYQDGTAELEVLHTGPPRPGPQATSPPRCRQPGPCPWPPPPTWTTPSP
jgi:hypothetical protein